MLGFDFDSAVSLQRFEAEFEDLGKIGSGGFSTVNKVRNKRDKKLYALKVVKIKPSELKAHVFDYLEKILGEAKIISDLSHPNILEYHGCWINADLRTADDETEEDDVIQEQEEELELVMEEYDQNSCGIQFDRSSSSSDKKKQANNKLRPNVQYERPNDNIFGSNIYKYKQIRFYLLSQLGECSLQKYINVRNQQIRRNQQQKLKITIENYKMILDIIEGLSYIHSQKVIHRDIKLQNIIVDSKKRCKIIDFGLAKKVRNLKSLTIEKFQHEIINSDDSERHSSSVGTRIFSSPEQSNSENYDHRTDIYSLAMVIGIMFSQYSTSHEEGELLLNLRSKKLQNFNINEQLKSLLYKALSQQKSRPDLKQIKDCIKRLLKQAVKQSCQLTEGKGKMQHSFCYKSAIDKVRKQQSIQTNNTNMS